MTPEQKQRAIKLIAGWRAVFWRDAGNDMAALLQELIEAPEQAGVPVAYMTRDGIVASRRQVETNTASTIASGFTIPLYAAPPVNNQSEHHLEMVKDAERYRWLRDNRSKYGNGSRLLQCIDSGWLEPNPSFDSAIDAARSAQKGGE